MRTGHEQSGRDDLATRIGRAARAIRIAGSRRRSRLAWRAAQLSALATAGIAALFVHGATAQTAGAHTGEHSPATPAQQVQPASTDSPAPVPTLAPPSAAPAPAPGAVQSTSSGSTGSASSDDDGHGGKDGDGDADD